MPQDISVVAGPVVAALAERGITPSSPRPLTAVTARSKSSARSASGAALNRVLRRWLRRYRYHPKLLRTQGLRAQVATADDPTGVFGMSASQRFIDRTAAHDIRVASSMLVLGERHDRRYSAR